LEPFESARGDIVTGIQRTAVGGKSLIHGATDVFDYIEMFYNPIRQHGSAGNLSLVEFERRYALNGS
jgi:transposase InsO family protein